MTWDTNSFIILTGEITLIQTAFNENLKMKFKFLILSR